jgi:Domain of unknown function (DUF4440)
MTRRDLKSTQKKEEDTAMQKALLLIALSVSWVGYARAQQTIGPAAETTRAQLMQFETDKVPLLLQGGAAFADWLQKMDADDTVYLNPNGTINYKTPQVDKWRSGKMTQSSNFQRGHEVFVYNNGNVAIVTYIGTTVDTVSGVTTVDRVRCADTWVKQNGGWLRVVHANTGWSPDPKQSAVSPDSTIESNEP